ncbi:MAG: hypothetical protein Q8O75_02640, partial [bacterium]|nr:hypothetical protein [bacterium]
MKSITVLAFGISVVVALFGLLPVVAIIKNGDLGILQNSSPGVEVTVSSGAPPAATSVPTPSPSPTLVPTSTPSPTVGIEFKEGHSYAIEDPGCVVDCGIPIRAAPTSESRQVGTLQLGQEVEILGVIDGQMWLNWGQNIVAKDAFPSWTNKWYQLEKGYIYSAFIFIPMPGELSPIVSGEKWVEVDRANQILHAYVDGREVFQAPIGVG